MIRSFSRQRIRRGGWAVSLTVAFCLLGGFGGTLSVTSSAPAGSPPAHAAPVESVSAAPLVPAPAAPPGALGSLTVTIHNIALNRTGTYQQPVSVNSSRYGSLINANWSNGVAYYTANDTPIYSWIESGASNSSTDTLLWLRLASLPGGGWTNVSLYFWPKTSFNLSEQGYTGEAPELSSPYAEFDNGWRVFDAYSNFSGHSLGPAWTALGGWSGTVNGGLHVASSPGNGAIETSMGGSFPSNATVEAYARLNGTSGPLGLFMAETAGYSAEYQFLPSAYAVDDGFGSSDSAVLQISNSTGAWRYGTPSTFAPVDFSQSYHVLGLSWLKSSSNESASANYLPIVSTLDPTNAPMTQMGLFAYCGSNCTSADVSWVRSRDAPTPLPQVSNMGFSPLAVGVLTSPLATDLDHLVSFRCEAAGGVGPYAYAWSFGDTGTDTGRIATHTYASLGTFEARCTASDSTGAQGSSVADVVVNVNPAIVLFQALPSTLHLGGGLNLVTNVSGGTPPLRFTYSGLPPGCLSRNSPSLSCLPGEAGTFAIEVIVTDAVGQQTSSFVTITVGPAVVSQNSTPFSPAEGYAIAGAVAGVVVLAGVLPVLWWSRRRPPERPNESSSPEDEAEPVESA